RKRDAYLGSPEALHEDGQALSGCQESLLIPCSQTRDYQTHQRRVQDPPAHSPAYLSAPCLAADSGRCHKSPCCGSCRHAREQGPLIVVFVQSRVPPQLPLFASCDATCRESCSP